MTAGWNGEPGHAQASWAHPLLSGRRFHRTRTQGGNVPDQRDEEQTFGAYAHGGSTEDLRLEAQGAPGERVEQPQAGVEGEPQGGALLPSQASLPEVPASCGDARQA